MTFTYGKSSVKLATGGQSADIQLTSFGELQVSDLYPTAQGDFVYGFNPLIFEDRLYAGGDYSVSGSIAFVNSSTSASGLASIRLRRSLRYRAGQGALFRGTAIFSDGTVGNNQLIGAGNIECGYFFGYMQEEFGIIHIDSSEREIRALTVTTGAATGDVTVTLGDEQVTVPVTGANDAPTTAYQLSLADYRNVGNGWDADAIGDTVYFLSARPEPIAGTYSVSGASIVGSFDRTQQGTVPDVDFIPQADWNIDRMDGTGPTRMSLDPTKGNVYQIGFQYLGFGNAYFGIEDEKSGRIKTVHVIENSNKRLTPILKNPNVAGQVISENIPGYPPQDVQVGSVSMATFNEGRLVKLDPKFGIATEITIPDTNGIWKPVLAIKADKVLNDKPSFGEIDLLRLAATNDSSSSSPKPFLVGLFVDCEITGEVDFQLASPGESAASIAILDPTTQDITPNDRPFFVSGVGSGTATNVDLEGKDYVFGTGRVVVIAVKGNKATTGTAGINWYEQQ